MKKAKSPWTVIDIRKLPDERLELIRTLRKIVQTRSGPKKFQKPKRPMHPWRLASGATCARNELQLLQ